MHGVDYEHVKQKVKMPNEVIPEGHDYAKAA